MALVFRKGSEAKDLRVEFPMGTNGVEGAFNQYDATQRGLQYSAEGCSSMRGAGHLVTGVLDLARH